MRLHAMVTIGFLALACSACGDRCVNREIASHPSPSGAKTAVVFSRECGTTEKNVQVAVIPASADLANVPGNAFIVSGQPTLTVRWQSNETLSISGYGTAKVHKQESSVADTAIYFEPGDARR